MASSFKNVEKIIDDETNLTTISSAQLTAKNLSKVIEEDPTSLWQYSIHRKGEPIFFGYILVFSLSFFYFSCFYAVFAQLVDMPNTQLTNTKQFSNEIVIWISKIFFLIFLIIQAESECIDGYRLFFYAQGTRKTIMISGFFQFFFGCLVEFISFSLIHRSNTIFNIMSYSACLTVFLRVDDVFVSWMTKMFPETKKKVNYDKGAYENDPKTILKYSLWIKISFFIGLEVLELAGWYVFL